MSPGSPSPVRVPPAVLNILQRLEAAGFETWCVGGAIRDALLGGTPQDFDLATAATPPDVRRLFPRTVPIGIEHGTVGVLDQDGVLHEVTTFRKDVTTDGRHAVVAFGVSLDDDLARRDFTINAIAWHPLRQEWRDPFDGRRDLDHRVLRAVGDAATRFREDRLRILRAIRFASRLTFTIDPETRDAILAQGPETGHLSAERVRDEWVKSLASANCVAEVATRWLESGVAAIWLPELLTDHAPLNAMGPPGGRPADPVLVTATCTTKSGTVWRRFKGSALEIRRAEAIDRGPRRPVAPTAVAVRRWMAKVGEAATDLLEVERWRVHGADRTPEDVAFWTAWERTLQGVVSRGEATSRSALAIRGDDLVQQGIVTPGPAMGSLLDQLLEAVLHEPALNQREPLLELARTLV